MRVHVIVLGVFRVGRVQIESCTSAEIPVVLFAFDASPAGGRVGEEESDPLRCGGAEEGALLSTKGGCVKRQRGGAIERDALPIIFCACEAREVDEHGDFGSRGCVWWEIKIKVCT